MNVILSFMFAFMGVAMAIEEPAYTVISKMPKYEVRQYGPIFVAENKVSADFENAGNQAFRILAAYIFGENKSKSKISMTAPVTQSKNQSGYLVQFTMPKSYHLETLPVPIDSRVELREVAARKVAVFSYSGSWSESRYNEKLAEFKEALKNDSVQTVGEPTLARYNSPFQLWFLRRNEIWIEIAANSPLKK